MDLLQRSNIEIHKVCCGELFTISKIRVFDSHWVKHTKRFVARGQPECQYQRRLVSYAFNVIRELE